MSKKTYRVDLNVSLVVAAEDCHHAGSVATAAIQNGDAAVEMDHAAILVSAPNDYVLPGHYSGCIVPHGTEDGHTINDYVLGEVEDG